MQIRHDPVIAQYAIDFIQELTHTKGKWAGQPFVLLPWQLDLISRLFGTVYENDKRVYNKCYVEIPKKNGKSEIAAAIALFLLFADGEMGGEIYGAAADRKQASIVFDVARQMVLNNPDLNPDNNPAVGITPSQKRIFYRETNSFYDVLSADAYTKHGFNIHGCIFDELHAQPKRDLWDVLTEGAGDAREQPLTFAITTAGYDRNSICWEVHEQAMDIKNGVYKNENFLPIIYTLDEKDDWKDEANWYKVNPSLDVIIDIEKVRTAFREAEHIPAKQNTFKRLRLCQWTQQSDRFIDMNLWDSQAGTPIDESELIGRQGCGGLDLASVSYLTAFLIIFKH